MSWPSPVWLERERSGDEEGPRPRWDRTLFLSRRRHSGESTSAASGSAGEPQLRRECRLGDKALSDEGRSERGRTIRIAQIRACRFHEGSAIWPASPGSLLTSAL